jgi:subtilisin family serine protease
VCIYSTWKNGGYNTISGTSMASPHIAGAAALYNVKNQDPTKPEPTPSQVMSALRTDAESWDPSNGFTGDPRTSPAAGRHYGYLTRVDLY